MNPLLIKYFKTVAVEPDTPLRNCREVNQLAIAAGYAVTPEACTDEVVDFLKDQASNFNTTFYKSWEQIESLSEQQMVLLQLVHYLSTYGTGFSSPAFTLNPTPEKWHFDSLSIITACTPREMFDRISALIATPVALSDALVNALTDQLIEYDTIYAWRPDVDKIANRQIRTILMLRFCLMPSNADEMVALIFFACTAKALIIKNKATFRALENTAYPVAQWLCRLTDVEISRLSEVFFRFKPIFIALKHAVRNNNAGASAENQAKAIAVINRIGRLAPKNKRPIKTSPLGDVLNPYTAEDQILSAISLESNCFWLIRLYNYLTEATSDIKIHTYIIRNGKVFIRDVELTEVARSRAQRLRPAVMHRLVELLSSKALHDNGTPLTVAYPESIELAAPVSERQFVGNIPYGSYYNLGTQSFVGVYWRNEWGTRDFDLWMMTNEGMAIGWSADHKSGNILFSGDMTNADPEATEIMWCRGEWPDSTVRVVRYCGNEGSRFRIFFGTGDFVELPKNYMVDPSCIRLTEDLTSDERETTVGVIFRNRIYFTATFTGTRLVPSLDVPFGNALALRLEHSLMLRQLLSEAGFAEFDPACGSAPDIDLTNLNKDTILNIFAK